MDFEIGGKKFETSIERKDGKWLITIDSKTYDVAAVECAPCEFSLLVGDRSLRAAAVEDSTGIHLWVDGETFSAKESVSAETGTAASNSSQIKVMTTTVPGKVVKVAVTQGSEVKEGDLLTVIEAMKMENQIRSPRAGKIKALFVAVGNQINFGAKLVEYE